MTLVSPSVCVDSVLGIDVAKAKVDTWFERVTASEKPTHQRYDNSPAGHQRLLAWLTTQAVGQLHVCLEATGTYSDALALCLHQAGYRVSLVNPLRIKRYGESELRRIKTDKSDAALIARFCLTQQPDPWTPLPPERRELQDLVRSLQDVKQLSQQQGSRHSSGPHTPIVTAATTRILTCLGQQQSLLEQQIRQHILAHKTLATDYALLLSIVSIGPKTAAVLLAELGDLRRFANVRDLVAYVGLCPRLCSSGSSLHGPTPLTKRGNAVVRKALYFPALNALRFNPCLRPFYHRLLAQGKPKMVAVAAVMRKLVHLAYGVLLSGQPFDPAHVSVRPAQSQETLHE
ncbi:MAG TPA: IS110 family transposase [Ktedonobacteraceae bacterium]|nr:IS110 family transposase [Ktedonobacteraceae bacterium]